MDHAHYLTDGQEARLPQESASKPPDNANTDFAEPADNDEAPTLNLDYLSTLEGTDKFDISDNNHMLIASSGYCPEPLSLDLIFPEDLGPQQYKNILETSPSVGCKSFDVKNTNSSFSDHIDALERCVLWNYSRWNTAQMLDERYVQA